MFPVRACVFIDEGTTSMYAHYCILSGRRRAHIVSSSDIFQYFLLTARCGTAIAAEFPFRVLVGIIGTLFQCEAARRALPILLRIFALLENGKCVRARPGVNK